MTGLEALEEIGTTLMFINKNTLESKPLKEVMPNYYNIIEKSLKALEIIKDKQVDVCELKICIDEYEDSLYQYNKRTIEKFRFTEEEFDLLKEVLE